MKTAGIIHILIMGPQGSGKGTQAKMLAEELDMKHLSSGDALRAASKTDTPLGHFLQTQMAKGTLTPIPKLLQVFDEEIKKVPVKQGIVFDGFCRQLSEAKILMRELKRRNRHLDAAIMIDIPSKLAVERLSKRLSCDTCNYIFSANRIHKEGGKCPRCRRGTLIHRSDDRPDAIRKRLALYRRRTLRVAKLLEEMGLLTKIDGSGSVEHVHHQILEFLGMKELIIR